MSPVNPPFPVTRPRVEVAKREYTLVEAGVHEECLPVRLHDFPSRAEANLIRAYLGQFSDAQLRFPIRQHTLAFVEISSC